MNPLLIAGAASALSLAKDIFTGKLSSPSAAQANSQQSAQEAATKFNQALETQTALNAQKAKVEMEARLAKPLSAEAQSVAIEAFNTRQEHITDRLQKGMATGQITASESDSIRSLQATAQAELDKAMADGVLTVGEFRQVNGNFDQVSRKVAAYRFNQDMASPQSASGSSGFSASV